MKRKSIHVDDLIYTAAAERLADAGWNNIDYAVEYFLAECVVRKTPLSRGAGVRWKASPTGEANRASNVGDGSCLWNGPPRILHLGLT